jgi:ATP synthase subunit 6
LFLSVSVVVVGNPIDQFLIIGQCSNLLNVTNLFVTVLLVTVFALILNINYAALYSFFNSYNQLSSGTLAPVVGYSFYLYTVFTSICGYNLSGLIPYNLTVTSLALTTLFLGCQSFFGLNVVAFSINNAKLVGLFLPSGSPLLMSWFLVFLEVVSYNVRVLSLSIRLFANMLAGHALAKILGSFV